MPNLTLAVNDHLLTEARSVAAAQGKSLNQLVREYLERITAIGDVERELEEFRALSDPPLGDSKGWRFDRDEIHERS